ncbi:hypothetical protein AUC70_04445 [Methyloceanibacter stevinii]|uniref:Globin n=1 Tax=Methyloceanibacter stevinii TaxID=1774970 RepID=A0A1E3VNA9_9HYPH|nr:group III truncated hemoglobin [Methyloceanibacter stevinii]ODR95009.1 hypothetical protein AUC70_04445 [Methyloceanibacter stevinii]
MDKAGGIGGDARKPRVTAEEVARLVDGFYAKVRRDPQLEYVIDSAIVGDWAGHLARMRAFWAAAISPQGDKYETLVGAHLRFDGMDRRLLTRWIALFDETCSELFDEPLAAAFSMKATRIAERLRGALAQERGGSLPRSMP